MNKSEAKAIARAVEELVSAVICEVNAGASPPDEARIIRLERKLAGQKFQNLLRNLTEVQEVPHG